MKLTRCIISTSFTRAGVIGPCIQSVVALYPNVKFAFGFIETPDPGGDGTRDIIEAYTAGDFDMFPAGDASRDDISAIRNACLRYAEKTFEPDEWFLFIDTDERLSGRVPAEWEPLSGNCVISLSNGFSTKPMLFRADTIKRGIQFNGSTHEHLTVMGRPCYAFEVHPTLRYWEVEKTEKVLQARVDSYDIPGLEKQIEAEPNEPRWQLKMGDALRYAGWHKEASEHYRIAAEMQRDRYPQKAWALMLAAEALIDAGEPHAALDAATKSFRDFPLAESACSIAHANLLMEEHLEVMRWARHAINLGHEKLTRAGQCDPAALFDKPYVIMAMSAEKLGDKELAEAFNAVADRMEEKRKAWIKTGEVETGA